MLTILVTARIEIQVPGRSLHILVGSGHQNPLAVETAGESAGDEIQGPVVREVFREIWPITQEWNGDWRKEWHSFPLTSQ